MSETAATPAAEVLADAAFGAHPGRHPLPPAPGPRSRWHRAVALGGQGRHAAATAELAPLLAGPDLVLASLAASTTASLLRQLGGHGLAREWDGRALALLGGDGGDGGDGGVAGVAGVAQARADALTGLAADALGGPAPATARRLLDRAAAAVAAVEEPADRARVTIRLRWVRAETALRLGDPEAALAHARAGVQACLGYGSRRHRVKSQLVLAAACLAGSPQVAARAAEDCRREAVDHGLSPLAWASALCVTSVAGSEGDPGLAAIQHGARRSATASHWEITQRGGLLPARRRRGTPGTPDAVPLTRRGDARDDSDRL